MSRLERLQEARLEIQRAAMARWEERTSERRRAKAIIAAQGPGAADSALRQDLFRRRVTCINYVNAVTPSAPLPFGVERRMGASLDLLGLAPSEQARKAGRPVARLVGSVEPRLEPEGFATGFLIGPDLLMTNWHVFPSRIDAMGCGANFLYERSERGLNRGVVFALEPTRFYISDKALDFAVVAIAPRSDAGDLLADLGQVTLIEARPKILKGHPVNIIQHPEGGPKQYAVSQNRLVDILEEEGFLQYETDTLEGSSGAPAFSDLWELVALHHASIPATRDGRVLNCDGGFWTPDMGDEAVRWIANEGARISAIVSRLSQMAAASESEASILQSLLASTADPVPEAVAAVAGSGGGVAINVDSGAIRAALEPPGADKIISGGTAMSGIQFTFTGPVTINVTAATPIQTNLTSSAPVPVVAPAEEKSLRFDPDYDGRKGYDPDFLDPAGGFAVPIPTLGEKAAEEVLKDGDGAPLVLKYHHFELMMNRVRRLQMWSAVNVDYSPNRKVDVSRDAWGRDRWIADPRIPAAMQIFDADFYKPAGNIDRGHIVRREDNEWGDTRLEIEFANSDTFHWTNCTPQHEAFNQATPGFDKRYRGMEGVWGAFENHIQQSRSGGDTRMSIIAGPILADDDPSADFGRGAIQYPIRFFKIVCVVERSGGVKALKVFAFLFSQKSVVDRFGLERFVPDRFDRYQVPLADIEAATDLVFDPVLRRADVLSGGAAVALASTDQVRGVGAAG